MLFWLLFFFVQAYLLGGNRSVGGRKIHAVRTQRVRFISRCKLPHTFSYSGRKKLVKSYLIHLPTVNEPATWLGRLVGKVLGAVSPFWMTVPVTPLFIRVTTRVTNNTTCVTDLRCDRISGASSTAAIPPTNQRNRTLQYQPVSTICFYPSSACRR